jgi:myo-inositol 2-dehydrogenase / D-chiro-inositol 1-dehydrogenase
MRIGIVGLGRIGMMHARYLAESPAVDQVILVGRNEERLQQSLAAVVAGIQPGARSDPAGGLRADDSLAELEATTDLQRVLRTVDGVVVATTTATHIEFVREAVHEGVPVLVEKPLTLDYDELRTFTIELEAHRTPVMVAFHRRYDPGHQELRQRVLNGDAGTVRIVRATNHDHKRHALSYLPVSGGIWRDLLVHDFDVIPWVTGDRVVEVRAVGSVLDEPSYAEHKDVDTAAALLTLASGAFATVSGVRPNGAGQDCRLEVFGTKNSFAAGLDAFTPISSTEYGVPAPEATHDDWQPRFAQAYRAEIDYFTKLVAGEVENLTPPSEGLASLRIALAADESRRTSRSVSVEPV